MGLDNLLKLDLGKNQLTETSKSILKNLFTNNILQSF